jgi:hypothetical protein
MALLWLGTMTRPSLDSAIRDKVIWKSKRRLSRLGSHALSVALLLASGAAAATAGPVDQHLKRQLASADADTPVSVIVTV